MRRASRIDSTQREIVQALRAVGCSVQPLHTVGGGVPDLLVGYRGRNVLIECKAPGGKLTPDQVEWHVGWSGIAHICETVDQALECVREIHL